MKQVRVVALALLVTLMRPVDACPFVGYMVGGLNPHDSSGENEPSLKEDTHVLDRRMRKRFERHVIRKQL